MLRMNRTRWTLHSSIFHPQLHARNYCFRKRIGGPGFAHSLNAFRGSSWLTNLSISAVENELRCVARVGGESVGLRWQ